jgi:hypothetical protein
MKKPSSGGGSGSRTINRSAKSGEFVTKQYAKSHPSTTETEHRPKPSSGGKKGK